jgi:glycosyltransferase involved in cell wall biosynthesis
MAPSVSADPRVFAAKVSVLPWGPPRLSRVRDVPRARASARRVVAPDAAPGDLVLYALGRFVPYKRQANILRAFLTVAAAHPRVWLSLIGPASSNACVDELLAIRASASAAVRRRVVMPGEMSAETAHLGGDVLVHAAAIESWCRVIDEAWSVGRPSIVPAIPTIAERAGFVSVEGDPPRGGPASSRLGYACPTAGGEALALLVDAGSVDAIAAAMDRAITDAAWRAATVAHYGARQAKRSWRDVATQMEAIYRAHAGEATVP